MKTGVECEYFLIAPDGSAISDAADTQAKPCYDQQALMRRYEVITEICDAMIALGWNPYQNDHEDANGQFEMNWEYDTCARARPTSTPSSSSWSSRSPRSTACARPSCPSRSSTSPATAATRTSRCGPRPARTCSRTRRASSACRRTAYHFIGGVMHSAEALCAITNPTVNSYKRINAPRTASGATWSPNTVTYARQQPHAHDPHPRRRPLRAAPRRRRRQPLSAAGGAAGRGPRRHQEQARSGQAPRHRHVRRGPQGEGRQAAAAQPARRAARAREVERAEGRLSARTSSPPTSSCKHADWNDYAGHLTDWERQTTLDC